MIADTTSGQRWSWWACAALLTLALLLPCRPAQGAAPAEASEKPATKKEPAAKKTEKGGRQSAEKDVARTKRQRPVYSTYASPVPKSWSLSFSLDAPELDPPVVQFAVFDEDPLPDFQATAKRMKSFYQQRDKPETPLQREMRMAIYWRMMFKKVTGDEVGMLPEGLDHSCTISANSGDGKRWLVTKVVRANGKPICWYLPVRVKTGKRLTLTLSMDNTFDLVAAFDKACGDPGEQE